MSLIEQIFQAGIVGAGGAGFPTHKKLVKGIETLIINAVECEPLLAGDRYVMRHQAAEIIEALLAIKAEFDINKVIIGTKKKYSREIAAFDDAIAAQKADISIFKVESFYPAGDEQSLIYEVLGKSVPPGGIPLAIGVGVLNIATVANIYQAMQGLAVTRKYLTITGCVKQPIIIDVPIGTSLADCIAAAGGVTTNPYSIIRGGPMMGARMTAEQVSDAYVGKQDGGIIVLACDHPAITFEQKSVEHMLNQAKSVCIQCGYCTEYCPRYLIGHKIRPHRIMRSMATNTGGNALPEALLCCECGICELFACPMQLSPRRVNVLVKQSLREQGIKVADTTVYTEQTEERIYRRVAQSRFIHRLQLSDFPTQVDDLIIYEPNEVFIALKHGIGQASRPIVAVGDKVNAGDLIASIAENELGSNIHASIDGIITEITAQGIRLKKEAGQA